ncbi:hypothetical protein [Motilibacter deserti]|uniref:Abi-like protein n=1 Tax=Motilibacter deserti TaxID=2714956 RepID=A0ABX0GTI4_9ACTN|nr:hypothetical protein [Motilibacter deserti]NHC13134.1 hypothetical protein [Motilibacter deserti]
MMTDAVPAATLEAIGRVAVECTMLETIVWMIGSGDPLSLLKPAPDYASWHKVRRLYCRRTGAWPENLKARGDQLLDEVEGLRELRNSVVHAQLITVGGNQQWVHARSHSIKPFDHEAVERLLDDIEITGGRALALFATALENGVYTREELVAASDEEQLEMMRLIDELSQ